MNKQLEQPIPQGKYLPALRHADVVYTSGMTPRKAGELMYSGKIKSGAPIESHREAVRLSTLNALAAATSCLKEGEHLSAVLQLNVFLNTEPDFILHPAVADYASELLIEKLGPGSIGSRAAIGVASLPSDATAEISLIAKVR
ncbi:RidA family protein [Photobacterium sp. ZSDE20]|uniref:RidA family protein n=1 Tax=Photobacterium pectinilyticum TaxID=2906793 RepID=A0ABT1NBY6_9GAMM|nr:RidA family protein [Photobacterium sp. ZSDE20]MCQ1061196.1 RidA family protein [Photobacterium sp. ZSDE20]MDD1829563.1 RidA family protein [Photobacterium sp. ZSDE20]